MSQPGNPKGTDDGVFVDKTKKDGMTQDTLAGPGKVAAELAKKLEEMRLATAGVSSRGTQDDNNPIFKGGGRKAVHFGPSNKSGGTLQDLTGGGYTPSQGGSPTPLVQDSPTHERPKKA